jgi:hypothetical protein
VADVDGEHLARGLEVLPRRGHAASEHELEAEASGVPGLVRDGALSAAPCSRGGARQGRRAEWRGGGGAGQEETRSSGPGRAINFFFASAPGVCWR